MLKLTLLCLLFVPTLWAYETGIRRGYVRIDLIPGLRGDDGCLAEIDCATDKLPLDSDIVSVRLYHEIARNHTWIHVLLAKADQHTNLWMFRDRVQLANAGALFTQAPVCPGLKYCRNTTTYFIYPIQEENLGEYMCETRVRKGNQTLLYVNYAPLVFDRCCKACPYCSMQVGGVWSWFTQWSPAECNGGCVQQRQSERCLTRHCKGPEPVKRRRCFQDGVCDETELVKIHTERVKDRCRAKIQCTVDRMIWGDVSSVQLFYVWGPRAAVKFTGLTDVDYTGSILLAEATPGVNGGRFTEKVVHPNGGVDPDIPSDPKQCICKYNCIYTLDTVNQANVGDYACVIRPWSHGLKYAARLSFSDDCPKPSKETVREENCEQNCLETYMVEGHEKYIKHYCHKLCEVDEEVKESVWA